MKGKRDRISNKAAFRGAFVVFSIICIGTAFFCYQYYRQLQSTIRDESSGYLQEISYRIESNINRIISNNYSLLNSLSTYFQEENVKTFQDIQNITDKQKKNWNYENIMLIDNDGKAYSTDGQAIQLTANVYLQNAVINKENTMSMYQVINGKECVMFSIPLNNIKINNVEMKVLVSSYDSETFGDVLSMTSFNEKAYSHIISKDGSIVVRSTSPSTVEMGYNILSTIKNSEIDSSSSFETVQSDIQNNKSGQIEFTLDGVKNYMVYTPINPEDWYLLTFVPVSVVNAKSDLLLKLTILLTCVVVTVFAILLFAIAYIFNRNNKRLEQIAYIDEVTNGNTIQRFYSLAEKIITDTGDKKYAIVYTNIAKFKVMNEQFGRTACDDILKQLYHFISNKLSKNECMGRLSGDNFCILVEYKDELSLVEQFKNWFINAEDFMQKSNPAWIFPVVEFGIYVIDDDEQTFSLMIDRAQLSLKESTILINNKMRYAIYDDNVRRKLFREKHLEDIMEAALKNHEFEVYLQPKYRVSDEKIFGAEALTRWKNPEEGMIFPDEFIPLFEKNGFVVQLDLYVFEEVCKHLREWIDLGLEPIKISINCSKVHLKDNRFLEAYKKIADKYHIPRGLLEIELTESVVMEDVTHLIKIIEEIHEAGFSCSMDDFGSGYSSLNLVQAIPVDTLKIDKIFFDHSEQDSYRMEAVVSSIINMAKSLHMETVAEGVELHEHVNMLKKYHCDLIQGYVFAKPMPISEFEKIAFNKKIK